MSFKIGRLKFVIIGTTFMDDIENIKSSLIKNGFPPFLIDKVIKKYLDYKFSIIEEHIKKDNKSDFFKHLHPTAICFDSYNCLCFEIIHKANSKFNLNFKWRTPNLNAE